FQGRHDRSRVARIYLSGPSRDRRARTRIGNIAQSRAGLPVRQHALMGRSARGERGHGPWDGLVHWWAGPYVGWPIRAKAYGGWAVDRGRTPVSRSDWFIFGA